MRRISLVLGLLLLAVSWLGPLPRAAGEAFYAHMIVHMIVVAIAAPLLAYAIWASRFDPVALAPSFFAPIPASIAELVVVWGWHAPALHDAARHSTLGFVLEQGSFLLTGVWLWVSAFGGRGEERPGRSAAGVIGLLLTSMHMTLLGALLALAPRPLYLHHGPATSFAPSPLSALEDQQLGGALMILIGGASYLAGALWLTGGILGTAAPRSEPAP